MAIIDYDKRVEMYRAKLLRELSPANKRQLNQFLKQYELKVSKARLCIFLAHIGKILTLTTDFKREMNNRDKMNTLFHKMKLEKGLSYYGTIVQCALLYARWHNDGEKPKSLKDINNIKKKESLRNLDAKDMLTWEDGQTICKQTNSTMLKALISTQLDGGFRPSEFQNLKYGDIEKDGINLIAKVTTGKTGSRTVILWRCVPALQRWIQSHPTKNPKDHLWLQENNNKGKIIPYDYYAMRKRINELGRKAGIKKPLDFYNLRHSAATQTKKDNFPTDLAASKFGHSEEYYVNVYGRLNQEEQTERVRKVYGISNKKQKNEEQPTQCITCQQLNEAGLKHCTNCGSALSLAQALKEKENSTEMIAKLVSQAVASHLNKQAIKDELKKRKRIMNN